MDNYDVVVVGGGIVGLASARAILRENPSTRLLLLEKEPALALHQTGRNSGVIHSGIYYPPGSLKASMVAESRQPLIDLCTEHGVPFEFPGKVIVATRPDELPRLDALYQRGLAHGLAVRRLGPDGLRELEPHAAGLAAVHVPEAGITDYAAVSRALAADMAAVGARVRLGTAVRTLHERSDAVILETSGGEVSARHVVVCAGLHSDELAEPRRRARDVRIVPFRGEYYELTPSATSLVRSLVYPVPDPRFPFLGVHLTRGVDGGVHAGPNAVVALAREGYRWRDVDRAAFRELLAYPGMRKLARKYWRVGVAEMYRSASKRAFTRAVRRLVPELTSGDLVPATAGVRAQALRADGNLVDDFAFRESRRVVHVVNAPSPAATASLAIGRHIAGVLARHAEAG